MGSARLIGGIPPPWRNHRDPTGADTPTPTAASSLETPVAISRQNSRSTSRGGEGRPGDRTVIVRMQYHEPTIAYVTRRTAEGKTKPEIIRCLKRLLAREVWALTRDFRQPQRT